MARPGSVFLLFLCLALARIVLSCEPPDCDHEDCGSCGNACCTLDITFEMDADSVNIIMMNSFKMGGADGHYTLVDDDDLRQDNLTSGVKYLIKGIHTTIEHHYNQTMNFLVASNDTSHAVVRTFSISQMAGAYCDEGQNYKNIVNYMYAFSAPITIKPVFGCPKSKK